MNAVGSHIKSNLATNDGNLWHERNLLNFTSPLELGISVPLVDPKFISAFETLNASMDVPVNSVNIPVVQNIGNEVPGLFIKDFNDFLVQTCFVGPSSVSGYKESFEYKPGRKDRPYSVSVEKDIYGYVGSLSFALAQNDPLIISKLPQGMRETLTQPNDDADANLPDQVPTHFTVRRPKLINVHEHTNTLLGNFYESESTYLVFPTTERDSIDPLSAYRFSFYYRVKGAISITPIIQYFTNSGAEVEKQIRTPRLLVSPLPVTEESDFAFFDLLIPNVGAHQNIPASARKMRITLFIETTDTAPSEGVLFEIAYPLLEHVYNNSLTVFNFIPQAPSGISIECVNSGKLIEDASGKFYSIDDTKLFIGHVGRNLFKVGINNSLIDSNFVKQLRILENFNSRGDDIILRTKHHDLPPVLIGDFSMSCTSNLYDYHYQDTQIEFIETN